MVLRGQCWYKAETVTIALIGITILLELHAATSKNSKYSWRCCIALTGSTLTVLESIVVTNTKGCYYN